MCLLRSIQTPPLARDAIAEGIKRFDDPRVNYVTGIEFAWNYGNSLLTRLNGVNALIYG